MPTVHDFPAGDVVNNTLGNQDIGTRVVYFPVLDCSDNRAILDIIATHNYEKYG